MTDADYHSWRKPITLVITAPSGPFSVEWNALQNSLCILLAVFCISSMLIHPVWALITQSMGPSRASEPSLARMSFCSTKRGGRASWRSGWITFSPVSFLSLFKTKPFLFWPLTTLSQRPWMTSWGQSRVIIIQNKRKQIRPFVILVFLFSIQICSKTREAEITRDNAAALACTNITDPAESPVRGLSAPSKGLILSLSQKLFVFLPSTSFSPSWI